MLDKRRKMGWTNKVYINELNQHFKDQSLKLWPSPWRLFESSSESTITLLREVFGEFVVLCSPRALHLENQEPDWWRTKTKDVRDESKCSNPMRGQLTWHIWCWNFVPLACPHPSDKHTPHAHTLQLCLYVFRQCLPVSAEKRSCMHLLEHD